MGNFVEHHDLTFLDDDDKCPQCLLVLSLDGRRFYSDNASDPFVIVDDWDLLTPVLVFRKHDRVYDVDMFALCCKRMHDVCSKLFGDNYYLSYDVELPHFRIRCYRLLRRGMSEFQRL